MANGDGKIAKWIGIIISIVVISAGVISGYAVNNYRIGQTEEKARISDANNTADHNAIIGEVKESNKEILSVCKDMSEELVALKTEVRLMRRNHNGNGN
jgi:hypothetical protein